MIDFQHSVDLESGPKQKPKSKSGRLLVEVRDKIIAEVKEEVKKNSFYVPTNKVVEVRKLNKKIHAELRKEMEDLTPLGFTVDKTTKARDQRERMKKKSKVIKQLNKRIKKRLSKEVTSTTVQVMFTNERTTVEFIENGRRVCGTFTGRLNAAKEHLRRTRGVKTLLWSHFRRVDEDLIHGMWNEMSVY